MNKRKSPVKHHVRTHKRVGVKVTDYVRGHGTNPPKVSVGSGHKLQHIVLGYLVTIRYLTLPVESIPVQTTSYPEAILSAMTVRHQSEMPTEVDAIQQ